jgi:hypothetical protein
MSPTMTGKLESPCLHFEHNVASEGEFWLRVDLGGARIKEAWQSGGVEHTGHSSLGFTV